MQGAEGLEVLLSLDSFDVFASVGSRSSRCGLFALDCVESYSIRVSAGDRPGPSKAGHLASCEVSRSSVKSANVGGLAQRGKAEVQVYNLAIEKITTAGICDIMHGMLPRPGQALRFHDSGTGYYARHQRDV